MSDDTGSEATKSSFRPNRSALRTLRLIETVTSSAQALTLSELAEITETPKSSLHSLVKTLSRERYLRVEGDGYAVGPRLIALVSRLPRQMDLARAARPIMQNLVEEIGETCVLGVRAGNSVVYIEEVEGPHLLRYVAPLGVSRELYASALGKSILAYLPEEDAEALLRRLDRRRLTPSTKTSLRELRADLAEIRERGWAISYGESIEGLLGIAGPILDERGQSIAGIAIAAPFNRLPAERFAAVGQSVVAAARAIMSELGVAEDTAWAAAGSRPTGRSAAARR
jgi:DNA-binding IclR family transcriptional regulator